MGRGTPAPFLHSRCLAGGEDRQAGWGVGREGKGADSRSQPQPQQCPLRWLLPLAVPPVLGSQARQELGATRKVKKQTGWGRVPALSWASAALDVPWLVRLSAGVPSPCSLGKPGPREAPGREHGHTQVGSEASRSPVSVQVPLSKESLFSDALGLGEKARSTHSHLELTRLTGKAPE